MNLIFSARAWQTKACFNGPLSERQTLRKSRGYSKQNPGLSRPFYDPGSRSSGSYRLWWRRVSMRSPVRRNGVLISRLASPKLLLNTPTECDMSHLISGPFGYMQATSTGFGIRISKSPPELGSLAMMIPRVIS
jgi:hypothetical protein